MKLALLDRAGVNASDLVRAQRDQLAPDRRRRWMSGCGRRRECERIVIAWRREAMSATLRFLDALDA